MTITRSFVYMVYNLIKKLFIERYEQQERDEAMKARDKLNGWNK
tara:strand:+ start:425 stop:556 length:132 start_codon:yes stop_codon:yes gene_type:complete